MVVWGGNDSSFRLNTGGRYDPAADAWLPVSTVNAPSPRNQHTAVWTGQEMVVWGGYDGSSRLDTGGRYEPSADAWMPTSIVNAPDPRYGHAMVWTGRFMAVWGGQIANLNFPSGGGRYFVGDSVDDDGDVLSECDGDCNDGAATAFPGAVEICDGLDQDCNGAADDADADADGYFVCEDCNDADPAAPAAVTGLEFAESKVNLSWDPLASDSGSGLVYDVVRGLLSELPVGGGASETCLVLGLADSAAEDADLPPAGEGYWYLVRARGDCVGAYGRTSAGAPRWTTACSP
jgi:hypothetical protein